VERRRDAMPRRLGSRGWVGPLARAETGGKASRDRRSFARNLD
jgi:hypothetical protein